ncbi:MAG: 4-amino-4-deoxy-L-arabinose transferase-like glycosyltransferase, partial [Planctomycetota bacterium]
VPSARQGLPAPASRGRRLTAIALAILPVALWATAAVMQEPGLARDLFYGQHLERAVDGSRHGGPLWRHLERVPLQLMPWTPIVIAALFMRDRDPARRRFLLWAGSLFVFFSIVPSKRDLYLLPIYPAFALLTAHWMVLRLHAQRTHASDAQDYHVGSSAAQSLLQGASWVSRAQVGVFIVAGTLLSIASVWGHWQLDKAELRAIALPVLPFGLLLLASGLYAAHVARRKGDWFRPMVIGWTLALTVLAITVLPKLDANKSAESLALVVMERPERPVVVHCIGVRPEGFRFYGSLGRGLPAAFASELPRKKDRQGADFLALIRADRWEATENKRRKDLEIVYRQFVGSKEVLLVAVRSGP